MDNINILGKDALYQGCLHQYISPPLIQVRSILQGNLIAYSYRLYRINTIFYWICNAFVSCQVLSCRFKFIVFPPIEYIFSSNDSIIRAIFNNIFIILSANCLLFYFDLSFLDYYLCNSYILVFDLCILSLIQLP